MNDDDYDPVHAALLDASIGKPPSTCLGRYRKAELQTIAETWLALVKAHISDVEHALGQELRTSDLRAIISRLENAERRL